MMARVALATATAVALLMALMVGCASPGTQTTAASAQAAGKSPDSKSLGTKPRKPGGTIPAEGIESPTHETLFQPPTKLHSFADHIDITGDIGSEEWNDSHRIWVFAAPPGELTTTYKSVTMTDRETGEMRVFSTPEDLKLLETNYHFERTFAIRDLGVLRRVRLVAISVNPGVNVMVETKNYGLQTFDVTIGFPNWTPEGIDDNAFSDHNGPIRGMLNASVANPEMIDLYAQQEPPYPKLDDVEVAEWQPRPELSPGGPWLKIPIKKDDLYSIDGRWLAENGLDPAAVTPDSLVLISNGEEVAMVQAGPADASFSQGARLLFFGLESRSKETDERIYFLGQRTTQGKRGFEEASELGTPTPLSSFVRSTRIEEDNTLQTRLGNFLSVREMTWLWGRLVKDEPVPFEFRTPGLPGETPEAVATVHTYYAGQGVSGPVVLDVVLNGREMRMGATLTADRTTVDFTIPAGVLKHDLNKLELTLKAPQETPNKELPPIYFDAIEMDYNSLFKAEDGREFIEITEVHPIEGEHELQVIGFRPYRLLGLDISDPNRPLRLAVRDGEGYSYVDAALHPGTRLLLTEDDAVERAPQARKSVWQDWRESRASADVVVVHHSSFESQAKRLAQDIGASGLTAITVDVESIYEAYSGGELSTASIRRFACDAVNNWAHKPSYLIPFGDCTSDGRGISRNEVVNFVPTRAYKATEGESPDLHATEPYFGWINGEDELTDIIIGRISVSNAADADEVVQKVIDYRQVKPSYWTNRLVNLSDGGEFYKASQKLFRTSMADWFNEWTLSTVDYPWEDNFYLPKQLLQGDEVKVSPTITNMLLKEFDDGMGFVTFFGHGSPNIWSNQRLWFGGNTENSDNLRLNNRDRLPFMASFTCNNGAIDYPVPRWNVCISEDMMRVPNGGVIGCFVPSGPGYSERHLHLAEGFFKSITYMNIRNFGMVADLSRLYYQATLGADDHSRMFLLLGDPTLNFPIARADATIEVTPERFEESVSAQKVNLRVTASDRLTTGVAYLKGKDGVVLQQKLLLADGDGIITGDLDPELPVHFRDFKVVVQAWSETGGLFQVGKRVSRAPAEVVITNVEIGELNVQDPVRMSRRVRYSISNKSYFRQEAQLVVNRFADKARIPIVVKPLTLEGFEEKIVDVDVEAPVGAHVLEARVLPSSPNYYRIDLPSNASYDCMIIPHMDDVADLAIPSLAFRILPSRAKASSPMVETFVANLGPKRTEGDLLWGIKYRDQPEITGVRPLGPMLGHSVQRLRIPMRMQMDMKTLITVSLTGESKGAADSFPENNAIEKSLVPAMTADLRIVPESIKVEPGHLTEGVTVFVSGEVENIGAQRSYGTEVSLFAADDTVRSMPLRSIAGQPQPDIPPLNPRERWPFRVRWDPTNNLGIKEIIAMVDSREMLIEPNKTNNVHRVALDVKTAWRLVAEGMKLEPGTQPGTVILVAIVRNDGETDAQRVNVNFYKDEQQSKENWLNDVMVERIPAKSTAFVRLLWQPSVQEMNESRRPSFDMAIKGSQQRFSSVATSK